MTARLLIQSGIAAGTHFSITRGVTRIGGAASMDLIIPSDALDPHVATLEHRDGGFRVHNRSSAPIYLGGRSIEPGDAAPWRDTDLLELPDEIRLAIEVGATSASTPARPGSSRPATQSTDASPVGGTRRHAESVPKSGSKSGSSTALQLAITLACILGCIGLLARDRSRAGQADLDRPASFSSIVETALALPDAGASTPLREFQYAESAFVRDNMKTARKRLVALRARLMSREDRETAGDVESDMLRWVEYRLGEL